ncbi:uncharacterized protein LOC116568118 isoform X2 [Mustela erminea]|nr:uncharacterized protein LOC116568118 isoform X2 [Mustela erminea]
MARRRPTCHAGHTGSTRVGQEAERRSRKWFPWEGPDKASCWPSPGCLPDGPPPCPLLAGQSSRLVQLTPSSGLWVACPDPVASGQGKKGSPSGREHSPQENPWQPVPGTHMSFQPTPAHGGRWIVSGRPAAPEEARPATPSQRAAVHLLGGEPAHGGEGSRGPLLLICCRCCKSAGRRAGNLHLTARWSPGAPCRSVDKQIPRPDAWQPSVLFFSYRRNSLSKSRQHSVEEGLRYTPGTEAVGPQLLHTGAEPQPPPRSAAPPSPRAKRNLWCLASPALGLIEPLPEPRACLLTGNPISKSVFKASDTVLSGSPVCGVHSILFRKLHPFSKRFVVLVL